VDPATSYRIVTNTFLADGGDSFSVFTQGMNRVGGGEDLVAFTEYFDENSPSLCTTTGSPASKPWRRCEPDVVGNDCHPRDGALSSAIGLLALSRAIGPTPSTVP
jgi:hypothetical protein